MILEQEHDLKIHITVFPKKKKEGAKSKLISSRMKILFFWFPPSLLTMSRQLILGKAVDSMEVKLLLVYDC